MRKILFIFFLSIVVLSCKKETKTSIDVSQVAINYSLDRFDVDFYTPTKLSLVEIKEKYPLLFPITIHDSIWVQKRTDTEEQELFTETQKVFENLSEETAQISSLFKHIKYYNSKFKEPKVITMLTDIDYENRVIYADSLLLISLDAYLGKNHEFYNDYPKYIKQNNHKDHLIIDVANAIIDKQIRPNTDRTFLAKMINEGKKMYVLDVYLPTVSDKEKAGYSSEKIDWAINSEEEIWKYFIENNLLYSTETKLNKRFLETAPFSKFYLGEDNLSPGKIGVWIGWQIVRSYMQKNDVSLPELLQKDSEEVFKRSKYKPRR